MIYQDLSQQIAHWFISLLSVTVLRVTWFFFSPKKFPCERKARTRITTRKRFTTRKPTRKKHSKRPFYVIQAIQIAIPENEMEQQMKSKRLRFTPTGIACGAVISGNCVFIYSFNKNKTSKCLRSSRWLSRNSMWFQSTAQSEINAFTVRLINNNRLKCQIDVCAIIFVLNVS